MLAIRSPSLTEVLLSAIAILGVLGVVSMEGSYLPQIVRLYRLKRADEVSFFFPAMSVLGRVLAVTYALASSQPLFSIGFCVGIALRVTLLAQTFWYRSGRAMAARAVARAAAAAAERGRA